MKILIFGSTGFIGRALIENLSKRPDVQIIAITRPQQQTSFPQNVQTVSGNPLIPSSWESHISEADVVLNFCGSDIAQKWTTRVREEITKTRIELSQNIAQRITSGVWINASAVGYYGYDKNDLVTEKYPPGSDFLANIAKQWEDATLPAHNKARVVILRMGVILGAGGVLEQMTGSLQRFLGGKIGTGKQWFSWVHMADLVNIVSAAIDDSKYQGAYNVCSPNPVQYNDLNKYLGQYFQRPSFLKVPSFALKAAVGEFANTLLYGQRVYPERLLQEHQFQFQYPQLAQAIEHLKNCIK